MATRGRPFEPGNKSGRGRPKGSRNKVTQEGWKILKEYHPSLMRKLVSMGLNGDPKVLASIIKMLPQPKPRPLKLGKLTMKTVADLVQAHELVAEKLGAGEITIEQAGTLDTFIEHRRKLLETNELDTRMREVEEKLTVSNKTDKAA
jgi:hypothetical protein